MSLPVASGISSFAWRIRLIKEVIQHETQSSSSIQSFGNAYEITHFFMHRRVKTENEPSLLCHFATYSRKGKKAAGECCPAFGVITRGFLMTAKTGFDFELSFLLI